MRTRDKSRFKAIIHPTWPSADPALDSLRGTVIELGDIVGPVWGNEPWDAELGIAYHGESGPVYYTGNGTETTDDIL